ncbi:MAG: DNA repair protein RecN [Bacteroidota bacterium]
MITSLSIKNYALIEELEMAPNQRLNVITGETGAGKSIMLGAVGLLLGNRADVKVLLNESEKCVVEGTFSVADYKLQKLFDANELEYEEECIIRREINPNGKSRAFVNDSPTTLAVLKALGSKLMDVHSQHESLNLGDNTYQLQILDAFAAHEDLLRNYQRLFEIYDQKRKDLQKLQKQAAEGKEDIDYKQFLFTELSEANLDQIDKESLEKELEVLENAENIKLKLSQTLGILDESEVAVLQQLSEVRAQIQTIASFSDDLNNANGRLQSTIIELQDLLGDLNKIQEKVEHDPERANTLKSLLDTINRLEKKHQVLSVAELITIRDELDDALQSTMNLDGAIQEAKAALEKAEEDMLKAGKKLSESRKLSALNFADEIEKIIKKIGIENGSIEIAIKTQDPAKTGVDLVEMLFSANKGIPPQELKEVASGGEFSRLIFAIKFLIADKTALPTIIFDEIDTGVSGEVAIQMVQMMQRMAKNHQVISISHLPQFAAGGDAHYFVYKDHSAPRSISRVKKLAPQDRIEEIAKMIGGQNPGTSALDSAKELLKATLN